MTRDDIIRMARKAGHLFVTQFGVASATPEWIERFFRAAYAAGAAAERNAILQMSREQWFKTQADFEEAIRARGEQK